MLRLFRKRPDSYSALNGLSTDPALAIGTAAAPWVDDLLHHRLPWDALEDGGEKVAALTAWLVRHAPTRLRTHRFPGELLNRMWLLSLSGPTRGDDPHWPR